MKTILKQALITPGNYRRIAARIVPPDQREAVRPGLVVSHYAFTHRQGQSGHIVISHTTRRAGICFAEERTQWGKWSEETGIITTDNRQQYACTGGKVLEILGQTGEPQEPFTTEYEA